MVGEDSMGGCSRANHSYSVTNSVNTYLVTFKELLTKSKLKINDSRIKSFIYFIHQVLNSLAEFPYSLFTNSSFNKLGSSSS